MTPAPVRNGGATRGFAIAVVAVFLAGADDVAYATIGRGSPTDVVMILLVVGLTILVFALGLVAVIDGIVGLVDARAYGRGIRAALAIIIGLIVESVPVIIGMHWLSTPHP